MATPPQGIEGLPAWAQISATIIILLAGGGFAVFGYVKKGLEAMAPHGHQEGDTVVVSGAFADGRPIIALTEAVKTLDAASGERAKGLKAALDDLTEAQDRTTAAVDRQTAASDRVEYAIRDLCRETQRRA